MQKTEASKYRQGRISIGRFSDMIEQDRKLFGCPTCGFRVSAKVEACPRCGAMFGSGAKMECPFCGESVERDSKECPVCQITYSDFVTKVEERVTDESIDSLLTEIIEIEAKKVKEEAKKLSCPKCSWMVDESEDKCPRCGNVFAENVTYMCPVCAALVRFEAEKCEECGADFLGEEDVEEPSAVEVSEPAPERAESEDVPAAEEVVSESDPEEEAPPVVMPEPALEIVEPETEEGVPDEPVRAQAEEERPQPETEATTPEEAQAVAVIDAVREPLPEEPKPVEEAAQEPEVGKVAEQKETKAEKPAVPVRRLKTRKLKAKPKR
jgi:RNA polymerase subunit RPABC4/transcription elongation factor Spt4